MASRALFCFSLPYFLQQSQLTVWTKCLNIQRLNNLSQGDRENIHFVATYESVYLRQQRLTLQWGWGEVREINHNNILQKTKREKNKTKHDNKTRCGLHFHCASVWFQRDTGWLRLFCFVFFILKLFDSTVTMKWNNSFCISTFAWLYFPCFCCAYFIILASLFVFFLFAVVS